VLFSINSISYGDESLLKSLRLIATLNKVYMPKATEYLKSFLKANNQSSKQEKLLKDFIKIGEFMKMSRLEQRSNAKNLEIDYKIFRQCFTCKGSRYIERKNRCKICNAKGKCTTCGADGQKAAYQWDFEYE